MISKLKDEGNGPQHMKVSFVILHYITAEDTIECISSINRNVHYDEYNIIVVDNCSPNDSLTILKEKYNGKSNVHFIKSKKNLGFAKGNNLGYLYAKKELNSDFVIMINNDTFIEQPDFILKIVEVYKRTKFHILGPDIISTQDKCHQNPLNNVVFNLTDAKTLIRKMKVLSLLNKIRLYNFILSFTKLIRINKISKHNNRTYIPKGYLIEKENVPLHGSCLVFSPDYVKRYNGLYSRTYMYGEEDILFYISQKEKLKTVYCPEIKIFHKEDSSTNAFLDKGTLKREFIYKNSISSLNEFIKILKDENLYKADIIDREYKTNQ